MIELIGNMKERIRIIVASFIAILGIGVILSATALPAHALNIYEGGCGSDVTGSGSGSAKTICGAKDQDKVQDIVKTVINTIIFVLGMIAVIMIVIGGVRYTTSNGDSSSVKAAKDTILYAVVGLVVAILAYAIVNFVLGRFS